MNEPEETKKHVELTVKPDDPRRGVEAVPYCLVSVLPTHDELLAMGYREDGSHD